MIGYITLLLLLAPALYSQAQDSRRALTPERLRPAIEEALRGTGAALEILEFSQFPAPEGRVEFILGDLHPPPSPDVPVRWRGVIHYGAAGEERFSIWAKVRVTGECTRVVAADRLPSGTTLQPAQLREETYSCFPLAKSSAWTMADVQNRSLLRGVRAGEPVAPSITTQPEVIKRGDEVTVEYRAGTLRLRVAAIAESSGHLGDAITVRNPQSKKTFVAEVESPGVAVITRIQ